MNEIGSIIKVSDQNIKELEDALNSLVVNKSKLVGLTEEYPLEIQFCGYRFVLENQTEIEELIASIDNKILDFVW